MITRNELLALVLPPLEEGEHYCNFGNKKSPEGKDLVRQSFTTSIQGISDRSDELQSDNYNSFFGVAKYGSAKNGRFATNAISLKSFFIDLDCGDGKPYPTLEEGLVALKDFCKTVKLPRPTILRSGRGAHVYWILEDAMERAEWKPHAEQLKELCVEHKFAIDHTVPADAARVLRVPYSNHVKDIENPIPVEVLHLAPLISNEKIKTILAPSVGILASMRREQFKRQMDPTTTALMGNYVSKFKTILIKSLEGEGCAQIAHIYTNQHELDEPLWRAGLSIAQVCEDRDKAIHNISKKHPEYNAEATEKKANDTKGPYTCETFRKINADLCRNCTLKVTSPIQIGREVLKGEEEIEVAQVDQVTEEVRTYTIPRYPFPYFRGGTAGGVYKQPRPDEEDQQDTLIYAHDFYIVKRVHDPEQGEMLWARLHLPQDGVRDFMMPLNVVMSKEKFVNAIATEGMAVIGTKKQEALMQYVGRWVEELQGTKKSEIARKQFGWLDDDSAFIVGDREIKATGEIVYSPPTATTLPIVPAFTAKGDFHEWKDIINAYSREGMESRAFAFFMGFGGPLMKFVAEGALDGFLLNLISKESGTGKTTVLNAINSIYGRPKSLLLSYKDTHNHRMQRLGTMQSMTPTIDELTNMEPKAMSNLVYDITSGQGKNRMSAKANVERINNATWQIPVVSSSNRAIKDALLTIKGQPEGELYRVLEERLTHEPNADPVWSRKHFGRLMKNYGHAIDPYAKYIAQNLPEVVATLEKVHTKLDRATGVMQQERFWTAGAAIAIAGGMFAKTLNLHDIEIKPIFDYAVDLVKRSRSSNKESMSAGDDFLGGFLSAHFNEILVINGDKDKRTGLLTGPIREPRGKLTARYEPDRKRLYILTATYRHEVGEKFMGFDDTLLPYKKSGAFLGIKKKRLMTGTSAGSTPPASVMEFDTDKLEFNLEESLGTPLSDGSDDQD
jgi:hypothetical protein